jgi:hypothetical protein
MSIGVSVAEFVVGDRADDALRQGQFNVFDLLADLRFPNELCTDKGRAINQQEPGWENTTHRRTEGNLSVLGQVFSAARLQAESTDRGLSRRFAW